MKFKFLILILIAFTPALYLRAQVIVGDKIIMTGVNPEDRKVKGLTAPTDENDAVNLQYFMEGKPWFFQAAGSNDTLILSISPGISQLVPGNLGNFIVPFTNDSAVFIQINGITGHFPLTKKGTVNLDSADLIPGQVVTIMFDGTRFQCLSELAERCPTGFIRATNEYCISAIEEDSSYFWPAVVTCGKKNARVCNWGEWYYACRNASSLGLIGMTNNFEWIDGGGNSLGFTSPPTANTGLQSGDGSCTNIMASIVDPNHTNVRAKPKTFHCCYSIK